MNDVRCSELVLYSSDEVRGRIFFHLSGEREKASGYRV